jgi:hypothetical protein
MSHSFYLSIPGEIAYDDVMTELGIPDVVTTEPVDSSGGQWPEGTIHLFIDNVSTRPLEVTCEEGTFQIRIFTCSSVEDYRLALQLAKTLARKYGVEIEPEDGEAMGVDRFEQEYDIKWATEHCHQMVDMALGLFQQRQATMKLAGTRAELEAGKRFIAQVMEDPESRHERFLERFRRLNYIDREAAFVGSKMILLNPEGTKRLAMAVFGEDVETVVPGDADAVAVRCNAGEMAQIPFDRFVEIVGSRGTWLSENALLVPAQSGAEWAAFFHAAKSHHMDDAFAVGSDVSEEERTEMQAEESGSSPLATLSEDEKRRLAYAPFVVFVMISAADGKVDRKELNAFVRALREQKDELLREVITLVPKPPQEIISEILGDFEGALSGLRESIEAADARLPKGQAIKLKVGLWDIANKVASASGGVLGFGARVSDEEKAALEALALILKTG